MWSVLVWAAVLKLICCGRPVTVKPSLNSHNGELCQVILIGLEKNHSY